LSNLKEREKPKKRCVNCGEVLEEYNPYDLYAARFCSEKCRIDYFEQGKK
jgi:predicted nucleic acid-binding Zn ribbon protein